MCLLEHGGDPNKEAYNKMTPLHAATWHGKKDIIDILIKQGTALGLVLLLLL